MRLVDLRHGNIIRSVSYGGECFLGIAAGGCFDDLHTNFHVGGEVDPVFVPDYFIKFERITTVVLPGDFKTHHGF